MLGTSLLLGALACSVQFGHSAPPPAVAGRSVELPIDGVGEMLVDPTHGHVFLSSPTSGAVAVVDFQAHLVAVIKDEPGAYGLALEGSTLFVSLSTAGGIDAIDTLSLTSPRHLVRGLNRPVPLAMSGGRLWTRNGECGNGRVQLTSVDAGSGRISSYSLDGLESCPAFAAIPSQPGRLLAWESGSSSGYVAVLDVAQGAPSVLRSRRLDGTLASGSRVVTPDGRVFMAPNGRELGEYRISDLTPDGVLYPVSAAAVSPDGQQLLGVARPLSGPASIRAVRVGWPVTLYTHQLPTTTEVFSEGLAFSPDGRVIFAATTRGPISPGRPVVFNTLAAGPGPGFSQATATPTATRPTLVPPRITPAPTPTPRWMPPSSVSSLTIPDLGSMVVDSARGRVFVSSPGSNSILVLDGQGKPLGSIPDEPGATALLLAGTTLYALLYDVAAVDVIDTVTMRRTRTLARGLLPHPHSLALAGGRLWTSSGDCLSPQTELAAVDIATGQAASYRLGTLTFCQHLAASRADQQLLALQGGFVSRIDIAGPAPVVTARVSLDPAVSGDDLVMTPDGKSFFVVGGGANRLERYSVATLQPDGVSYATRPGLGATAIAVSADGRILAVGNPDSYGPSVDVFGAGQPGAIASFALGQSQVLLPGGLGFAPAGRSLFAISRTVGGVGQLSVNLLDVSRAMAG